MRVSKASNPSHIVVAIREEMAGRGMYHKDLAAHIGITHKHLSQIMTGRTLISLPNLFRALDYLGMPLLLEVPPKPEEHRTT
jgi:transcriptional regulator with XRE-family HTH domain